MPKEFDLYGGPGLDFGALQGAFNAATQAEIERGRMQQAALASLSDFFGQKQRTLMQASLRRRELEQQAQQTQQARMDRFELQRRSLESDADLRQMSIQAEQDKQVAKQRTEAEKLDLLGSLNAIAGHPQGYEGMPPMYLQEKRSVLDTFRDGSGAMLDDRQVGADGLTALETALVERRPDLRPSSDPATGTIDRSSLDAHKKLLSKQQSISYLNPAFFNSFSQLALERGMSPESTREALEGYFKGTPTNATEAQQQLYEQINREAARLRGPAEVPASAIQIQGQLPSTLDIVGQQAAAAPPQPITLTSEIAQNIGMNLSQYSSGVQAQINALGVEIRPSSEILSDGLPRFQMDIRDPQLDKDLNTPGSPLRKALAVQASNPTMTMTRSETLRAAPGQQQATQSKPKEPAAPAFGSALQSYFDRE